MTKPELVFFSESDDGKFKLEYEKTTGDLFVNERKIAYEVKLTCWQNFFGFGASAAVMVDCLINIFKLFN